MDSDEVLLLAEILGVMMTLLILVCCALFLARVVGFVEIYFAQRKVMRRHYTQMSTDDSTEVVRNNTDSAPRDDNIRTLNSLLFPALEEDSMVGDNINEDNRNNSDHNHNHNDNADRFHFPSHREDSSVSQDDMDELNRYEFFYVLPCCLFVGYIWMSYCFSFPLSLHVYVCMPRMYELSLLVSLFMFLVHTHSS